MGRLGNLQCFKTRVSLLFFSRDFFNLLLLLLLLLLLQIHLTRLQIDNKLNLSLE